MQYYRLLNHDYGNDFLKKNHSSSHILIVMNWIFLLPVSIGSWSKYIDFSDSDIKKIEIKSANRPEYL